jgi:hypothetical protein
MAAVLSSLVGIIRTLHLTASTLDKELAIETVGTAASFAG